jgi:uncharacterized protein (TIGR02452 family)
MASKNMYEMRMGVWQQTLHDFASTTTLGKPTSTVYEVRRGKDWSGQSSGMTELPMDDTLYKTRRFPHTDVGVMPSDTLDVAATLVGQGQQPLVLNMADDCLAGGNVDTGSGAQEENLYRRTNLCANRAADQHFYPLTPCKLLLTKNVSVVRGNEEDGYPRLPHPFTVDIVSMPGIRQPKIDGGTLSKPDVALLMARLRLLFRTAARQGYSTMVLGPIGCGVWHNPPESVARAFKAVICEFPGVFRGIFFPILATNSKTLQVFTDVLVNDK